MHIGSYEKITVIEMKKKSVFNSRYATSCVALLLFLSIGAMEVCLAVEKLYPCGDIFSINSTQAGSITGIADLARNKLKATFPNEGCVVSISYYSFVNEPKGFWLIKRLKIDKHKENPFIQPEVTGYSLVSVNKDQNQVIIGTVSKEFALNLIRVWEFYVHRTEVFSGYSDEQGYHQYFGCNTASFPPVMGACHLPSAESPVGILAEFAEKTTQMGLSEKPFDSLFPFFKAVLRGEQSQH